VEYPATMSLEKLELDVSSLKLGEGLYVKDIPLPNKCKANLDQEELVVNVTYPKVHKVKDTRTEETAQETEENQE
jgi:large subunit ribosomal protein L25